MGVTENQSHLKKLIRIFFFLVALEKNQLFSLLGE